MIFQNNSNIDMDLPVTSVILTPKKYGEKMKKENVVLTGFMGTGKSTVSKLLAGELGYTFVDTDNLIEERCGMSIPDFFKEEGETAFRQVETEVTRELSDCKSQVISTGGGLILNPENVALLAKSSHIFCLVATPEEVFQRISADHKSHRPLLEGPDPMQRITSLLEERKKAYDQFSQITTTGKSPKKVAQDILASLRC